MPGLGLEFRALSKRFQSGAEFVVALDGLSAHIPPGQRVTIIGPNGSGKSTLLNLLAGQITPDSGSIAWTDDQGAGDWNALPHHQRALRFARVYQDPTAGTVPELTVDAHLRLVLSRTTPSPLRHALTTESFDASKTLLSRIGLHTRRGALVSELSAGQRQMLAVVLAVLRRPQLLLLDEHTASLDPTNAASCLQLTEQVCADHGITALMVTHRLHDAVTSGDRLLVLQRGRIVGDYSREQTRGLEPALLLRHFVNE